MVDEWHKAQELRAFANSLTKNITGIYDQNEKQKIISLVNWINSKADWIDFLVTREDELLGKKYDIHKVLQDIDINEFTEK